MPGTTTRHALPYPVPDDTVDVPRDVKALAEKVDPLFASAIVPAARVVGSGAQGPSTAQSFYYTDEDFDTANLFDSAAPTRLTIPQAGVYLVTAMVGVNALTPVTLNIWRGGHGGEILAQQDLTPGLHGAWQLGGIAALAQGDNVQFGPYHAGSNFDTPSLAVALLSRLP